MNDQTQPTSMTPAGAASELTTGLWHCWPWSHRYTVWNSTHTVKKSRTYDDSVVAYGVMQERCCQKCGKLQLRTVWSLR